MAARQRQRPRRRFPGDSSSRNRPAAVPHECCRPFSRPFCLILFIDLAIFLPRNRIADPLPALSSHTTPHAPSLRYPNARMPLLALFDTMLCSHDTISSQGASEAGVRNLGLGLANRRTRHSIGCCRRSPSAGGGLSAFALNVSTTDSSSSQALAHSSLQSHPPFLLSQQHPCRIRIP